MTITLPIWFYLLGWGIGGFIFGILFMLLLNKFWDPGL